MHRGSHTFEHFTHAAAHSVGVPVSGVLHFARRPKRRPAALRSINHLNTIRRHADNILTVLATRILHTQFYMPNGWLQLSAVMERHCVKCELYYRILVIQWRNSRAHSISRFRIYLNWILSVNAAHKAATNPILTPKAYNRFNALGGDDVIDGSRLQIFRSTKIAMARRRYFIYVAASAIPILANSELLLRCRFFNFTDSNAGRIVGVYETLICMFLFRVIFWDEFYALS